MTSGKPLAAIAPFNLEATVRVLQRRPANRVEVLEDGRYRRLFETPQGLVLAEVENKGSIEAPNLRWRVRHGEANEMLPAKLASMLGLDIDPAPLLRMAAAEDALRPTAEALLGMRPPRFGEWYEAFGNVIPFQQVSLEAGIAIVGRFIERFGQRLEFDSRAYFSFPDPAVVADASTERVRECGLSRTKAESLQRIARLIASGELSKEKIAALPTDDAIAALEELPGIGPWSAGLVLLRGLGRLDVFPPGDVGAMRGLNKLLRLESDDELAHVVKRFGEYRGYLYFHALGRSLLDKGLIQHAS
ncbi:MAG TPA: AlkA N-terminal domain-containing protein [Gammaproteobacteria bacterium]|nr:AlkA N-terminal domain-containing protein [Gammaproteobacteria bacterium]